MKGHPMRRTVLLLIVAAAGLRTPPLLAHHPVDMYLSDKTQAIEGELVQVRFQNPHSTLVIETRNESGARQRWAVEWAAGLRLNQQGITPNTLKAGDHVIVTGNPARNPDDHRLRMRTIARPRDGWKWAGRFE